jgi:hypothetical protein
MQYRKMISLKCPICLRERIVRADGCGRLCRSCRAKENSNKKIGKYNDISNKIFGKLTVRNIAYKKKEYYWNCKCACGNKAIISGNKLRSGYTKSCGCLSATQKGLSTSGAYGSWSAMIERCYDKRVAHYKRYGGRGIEVCEEWRNSFLNFYKDMGERPLGKTLDRINPEGNYCKENCRWITPKQQGLNRRNNRLITYNGKTQCLTEWANEYDINWGTLRRRLELNWNLEKALTKKVKIYGKKIKSAI